MRPPWRARNATAAYSASFRSASSARRTAAVVGPESNTDTLHLLTTLRYLQT